jgi:hypothetical protein
MIDTVAKYTVVLFGIFFILTGLLMLIDPQRARAILRKAGSTDLINYAEITIRLIPAAALIMAAGQSRYPAIFSLFGWFMLITSLVLYFVPRQLHHNFSLKAAGILKPVYFRLISPLAAAIGVFIIYCIA